MASRPTNITDTLELALERHSRRKILKRISAAGKLLTEVTESELCALLRRSGLAGKPAPADTGGGASAVFDSPVQTVCWFDERFPPLLREIPDPPLMLYLAGDAAILDKYAVAVVGARRCSTPGRHAAQTLSRELAAGGSTVVSGLAWGIDGAAHRGALECDGLASAGRTVAVLGAGFDHLYPAGHRDLARGILAAGGALVSEYPPSTPVRRHQFVERNRIISGLSQATIVVEAGTNSGSLITADFALEQGREVMAVPGWVGNPVSCGCHNLIKQGASLVTSAADVFEVLGIEPAVGAREGSRALTERELLCYELLRGQWRTMDEILASVDWDYPELCRLLVDLELAGFVEQGPLGYIARS